MNAFRKAFLQIRNRISAVRGFRRISASISGQVSPLIRRRNISRSSGASVSRSSRIKILFSICSTCDASISSAADSKFSSGSSLDWISPTESLTRKMARVAYARRFSTRWARRPTFRRPATLRRDHVRRSPGLYSRRREWSGVSPGPKPLRFPGAEAVRSRSLHLATTDSPN